VVSLRGAEKKAGEKDAQPKMYTSERGKEGNDRFMTRGGRTGPSRKKERGKSRQNLRGSKRRRTQNGFSKGQSTAGTPTKKKKSSPENSPKDGEGVSPGK